MTPLWRFSIDVGGTFTDCLARDPEGRLTILTPGGGGWGTPKS